MSEETTIVDIETGSINELKNKFFTFFSENQLFAIPISDVVQIVGMQSITTIPEYPVYAKGVINLRGTIIPVIDMRLRLGKEEKEYDERTCIIVTQIKDAIIGFIVDEVDAVTDIADENISPPPKISDYSNNSYLTGVARHEGKVVLLMDTQLIFKEAELAAFEAC